MSIVKAESWILHVKSRDNSRIFSPICSPVLEGSLLGIREL